MKRYAALWILSAALLLAACKGGDNPKNKGTFELQFVAKVGGQVFEKNQNFENILGQTFSLETFKAYISNIKLVKENGEELALADVVLYDFAEGVAHKTDHGEGVFKGFEVPAGKYKGLKFGLGVPAALNNGNPAVYADAQPLSVSQGMHWNWTTGYIFVKMDGVVDPSAAAGDEKGITYHMGTNELYREKSYLLPEHAFQIVEDEELQFIIEVDINRFFYNSADSIDMVQTNFTHSTPVGSDSYLLAEKIMNNFAERSLYKQPF
ncbi:MAG: hypothetical protein EAZ89_04515 [Bacteroidetes bacterium]|nr:MAG: hypothetical protein EAZ89_04515 [Bacteroidota bacterium]